MIEDIWLQILQGASNSTPLELFAVIFGTLSVWYAKKESILVFPTGIINVSIYVYICATNKLYADMSINAYYFVMSLYGWIVWSKKDQQDHTIPISKLTVQQAILYVCIAIVAFLLMYNTLILYTDSDVPFWDALTTSFFLIAMILMARKKIEHWIAWILGNLVSIPLYLYKGLAFTSLQYLVFTAIAVAGLISWKKTLEKL